MKVFVKVTPVKKAVASVTLIKRALVTARIIERAFVCVTLTKDVCATLSMKEFVKSYTS